MLKLCSCIVLALGISSVAQAQTVSCHLLFDNKQVELLQKIYQLGQPDNLSYSLMAIAWKESLVGKYNVNMFDPSFGVFHININTAMKRFSKEVKDTEFNRNQMAQRLLDDLEFSAQNARMELQYWHKIHRGSWRNTWASYNAGSAFKSRTAQKYADAIVKNIQILKECEGTLKLVGSA